MLNIDSKNLFKNNYKTQQIEYISFSKILSSFSVVILHTNSAFWTFNKNNFQQYWISANYIECIFYFAVPVFILSVGATLLDFNERYGLIQYYKKRIIKVVIPLISWNFLLYFYKVYLIKNLKKQKITITNIWNLYYQHKIYRIFESLHSFISLYTIIPLLAYIEKTNKIKVYSYCFITLFLSQSFFPNLIKIFNLKLTWIYNINVGYLIYIFAGYIIHNYKFSKSQKIIIYFFGISSLLIHIFGTQILTLKYKKIKMLYKGYLNFPCILYSCTVFIFIKDISNFVFRFINKKFINKISSLTLGPFFLHLPIKELCLKFLHINKFNFSYRLFGGIFICIICLIITFFLKKIPLINYIVP